MDKGGLLSTQMRKKEWENNLLMNELELSLSLMNLNFITVKNVFSSQDINASSNYL